MTAAHLPSSSVLVEFVPAHTNSDFFRHMKHCMLVGGRRGFELPLLAEADGAFLGSVFEFWEDHGGPLVAVDAASPVSTFLAPVVTARGGNASLLLHLLEFLTPAQKCGNDGCA